MSRKAAYAKAVRAIAEVMDALEVLGAEEDEHSRDVREEVQDAEAKREAELLGAAARIGERNRGGKP